MTGPTRVGGKKLTLTIGGIELHAEASKAILNNEEASSDVTTFADANGGGARQFFIEGTSVQSTDSDSFWRYVWANTGAEAAFVLRPHGNDTPTANEPHFSGTLTIGPKPLIGGEAGLKKDQTWDWRLDVDGEPVLDDGSVAVPTITNVSDDTPDAGDPIQVNGSRFTGVIGATVGGDAAAFQFVTDGILVVVVPDTATGEEALVIENGDGSSDPFTITVTPL